jgi:hypothetical protein
MNTHTLSPLTAKPASGPGAIDGYQIRCSCGEVISSSLQTLTAQWAREHVAYFSKGK